MMLSVIGCTPDEKMSVSNDGAIVIDVNSALKNEPRYLDDIVESVELIPLETTEASIVGGFGITGTITDQYIYAEDIYNQAHGLIIFERNGKFVKRILPGNGPEEVPYFENVFYSDEFLYILGAQRLAKYTSNGEFVDYQQFKDLAIDIQKIGDGFLTILPQYQNKQKKFKIIKYNSNLKKVSENSLVPIPFPNAFKSLSSVDGVNCLVYRFADNNIYNYANDDFRVKYRLEYPDYEYHLTYNDYKNLSSEEQRSVHHYLSNNMGDNKFIFSGTLHNSEDYLLIDMSSKGFRNQMIVYNKKTGKTWKCEYPRENNTIFNIMDKSSNMDHIIGQKNSFYGSITPGYKEDSSINNTHNLLSAKDIEILKNAKEDDNPIIVIYKLKDNL